MIPWLRTAWRRYTDDDGGPLVWLFIGMLIFALLVLYYLEELS